MFESITVVRAKAEAPVVVLGLFQPATEKGKAQPAATLDPLSAKLDKSGRVAAALKRPEATGDNGRLVEIVDDATGVRMILVGLGKPTALEAHTIRNAAASLGRRLSALKAGGVAIELASAFKHAAFDLATAGRAVGEALGLLTFEAAQFKGSLNSKPRRTALKLSVNDATLFRGMEKGLALAESVNLARRCSHTPPNICTPQWMADRARELAKANPSLKVSVMSGAELEKNKMIGLINVGKASENKPCLIRIEYTPAGASKKSLGEKPAVLIGKTMTYDSGGLSLKINNGMRGMKRDKDGGCAVLGAMHAVATVIKPKKRVVAFLTAAENSISDEAYRPDDIITFRNGVTVEVTNTDAEGRLVLADALCWACEKENPAFIVDLATLTGGVVTALGATYCGMWCEDDRLRARIEKASASSGDRAWRLPLHSEYRDMMKSDIADIINSNPNRLAHPIQGAAFLSYFVNEGIPWCHLDIAGVHAVDADTGPFAKGTATGFGVRLLADLLDG